MGVERFLGQDNVAQFPEAPMLLQDIAILITSTRSLIEERYSRLYFGSVGGTRSGSDEVNVDKETERAALLAVKDACDGLETAKKELEVDRLNDAKIKVAKSAKANLESALMELEMFL